MKTQGILKVGNLPNQSFKKKKMQFRTPWIGIQRKTSWTLTGFDYYVSETQKPAEFVLFQILRIRSGRKLNKFLQSRFPWIRKPQKTSGTIAVSVPVQQKPKTVFQTTNGLTAVLPRWLSRAVSATAVEQNDHAFAAPARPVCAKIGRELFWRCVSACREILWRCFSACPELFHWRAPGEVHLPPRATGAPVSPCTIKNRSPSSSWWSFSWSSASSSTSTVLLLLMNGKLGCAFWVSQFHSTLPQSWSSHPRRRHDTCLLHNAFTLERVPRLSTFICAHLIIDFTIRRLVGLIFRLRIVRSKRKRHYFAPKILVCPVIFWLAPSAGPSKSTIPPSAAFSQLEKPFDCCSLEAPITSLFWACPAAVSHVTKCTTQFWHFCRCPSTSKCFSSSFSDACCYCRTRFRVVSVSFCISCLFL